MIVPSKQKSLIHDLKYTLDPVRFAGEMLGINTLDEWQKEVLYHKGNMILNASRQSGKSTVTAIKALHRILYFPGSLVLLVSPSQRQSSELFKKVNGFLNTITDQPRKTEDNKLSVTFESGSRLVSLPSTESTVRGYSSPDLVIIDEASRASDDLYYAIRPMMAVGGGQMILLSTPFGKRGFFFDEWISEGDWKKILITADQCPRISQKFLDEEKKAIGEWFFKQEYFCEFVEGIDSVFTYEQVTGAIDDSIEPWDLEG